MKKNILKKLGMSILTVAMAAGMLITGNVSNVYAEEEQSVAFMRGDADKSGSVTLDDAQLILQCALGIINLENDVMKAADVDGKPDVTLDDAQLVLQVALGIINASELNATSVDESVIYDANNLKIKVLNMEEQYGFIHLNLDVENTSSGAITIWSDKYAVNGIMYDATCYMNVGANESVKGQITLKREELAELGINVIQELKISLNVSEDGGDRLFTTDLMTVQTADYGIGQTIKEIDGVEVYNKDGIRIIAGDIVTVEKYERKELKLFVENKTGKDIVVQAWDSFINDISVNAIMSSDVMDNTVAYTEMKFDDDALAEAGITDITKVQWYFHMFNDIEWSDSVDSDVIVVNFDVVAE